MTKKLSGFKYTPIVSCVTLEAGRSRSLNDFVESFAIMATYSTLITLVHLKKKSFCC